MTYTCDSPLSIMSVLTPLLSYLRSEQIRTHERMRTVTAFLSDPALSESALCPAARDSLETIRRNAEDDFSSIR